MMWAIELTPSARRQLHRLDRQTQKRLSWFLSVRVAVAENPVAPGQPMRGEWVGHTRFRVGDYRIIVLILRARRIVRVVKIGHRRDVYR